MQKHRVYVSHAAKLDFWHALTVMYAKSSYLREIMLDSTMKHNTEQPIMTSKIQLSIFINQKWNNGK